MKLPSHGSRRQDRTDDAMTPMIDIVFLLLIFFICAAAGQVKEAVLPTELSALGDVVSETTADRDPWIVDVWLKLRTNEAGITTVDMNGREYSPIEAIASPLQTLADVAPENPVILEIAPNVPMRDVVAVYDTCESAGFESVNFAAKAEGLRAPAPDTVPARN